MSETQRSRSPVMVKLKSLGVITVVGILPIGCQGLDSDEAAKIFVECLERNGVEAEGVVVTMDGDIVAEISLVLLSEGDVAYEPVLRQACTEEVELAN